MVLEKRQWIQHSVWRSLGTKVLLHTCTIVSWLLDITCIPKEKERFLLIHQHNYHQIHQIHGCNQWIIFMACFLACPYEPHGPSFPIPPNAVGPRTNHWKASPISEGKSRQHGLKSYEKLMLNLNSYILNTSPPRLLIQSHQMPPCLFHFPNRCYSWWCQLVRVQAQWWRLHALDQRPDPQEFRHIYRKGHMEVTSTV